VDVRPIGVFDSGLGGLTTVKKLLQSLPGEEIIYLGDTGRVPYGSRSKQTILKYAIQDAEFLAKYNIKAMIVACNTVCSVAYDALAKAYDFPVYEVVSAPAKVAVSTTKNNKIGVIGTAATIRSEAYEKAIHKLDQSINVFSQACPLFVPLAENGRTAGDDIASLTIARDYLQPLKDQGVDTLILGCTHYPLLQEIIAKVMGEDITLIDSGAQTASMVAAELKKLGKLSGRDKSATARYFVTDSIESFLAPASRILESEVSGLVEQVTIE
jgi:glutamate racemase